MVKKEDLSWKWGLIIELRDATCPEKYQTLDGDTYT
jgi:hypothetical protein